MTIYQCVKCGKILKGKMSPQNYRQVIGQPITHCGATMRYIGEDAGDDNEAYRNKVQKIIY